MSIRKDLEEGVENMKNTVNVVGNAVFSARFFKDQPSLRLDEVSFGDGEKTSIYHYTLTYIGSWYWTAVWMLAAALFLTRTPELSACITGSDATNQLTSTNGTCIPGNYASADTAALFFIALLFATMFCNLGTAVWNAGRHLWDPDGVKWTFATPGNVAAASMFALVGGYVSVMVSNFSALTTKTLPTMQQSVINANTTFNPPNWLNYGDADMIVSMIFFAFSFFFWLVWAWYAYNADGDDSFGWNSTDVTTVHDLNVPLGLSLVCLYASVGAGIGRTFQYNIGASYPSVWGIRQSITAAIFLYSFGAALTLFAIFPYWVNSWYESDWFK